MLDLIVKGGQLVTDSGVYLGNIGVSGGKIVIIAGSDIELETAKTIDAAGKIVMPGFIDVHVHDRAQVAGQFMDDAPGNISKAAAYGGLTTMVIYIGARWGKQAVEEFFAPIIKETQASSVTDFGVHCMLFPDKATVRDIPAVAAMGIKSFKIVLGYHPNRGWVFDDYLLISTLEIIVTCGGLAMLHCENGYVIGYLEDKFCAEGKYSPENFLKARPNLAEAESVYRTICFARMVGCPLYIVHLSAREGHEQVARARAEGRDVWAETCPQYMLLNDEHMRKQGALLKMAPPIRLAEDNEAMWQGLKSGDIEVVASDHASYSKAKKLNAPNFQAVPFGIPGVETIVPLLYSEGVAKGRITLQRMAQVLSENPAKKFGLYPRKGALLIGSDADMVIIDPDIEWEIKTEELHYKTGFTPYEGWRVKGKPVMSLLRGRTLLKDGELYSIPGSGIYLSKK